MSIEENKATAIRIINEVWSEGNLDVIDELVADDYVYHTPIEGDIHGPEGLKQNVTLYRTALPDLWFTVEDVMAEGNKVVIRWSAGGTRKGELLGSPATGKQNTSTGITITRFMDGKAVEDWSNWDDVLG